MQLHVPIVSQSPVGIHQGNVPNTLVRYLIGRISSLPTEWKKVFSPVHKDFKFKAYRLIKSKTVVSMKALHTHTHSRRHTHAHKHTFQGCLFANRHACFKKKSRKLPLYESTNHIRKNNNTSKIMIQLPSSEYSFHACRVMYLTQVPSLQSHNCIWL